MRIILFVISIYYLGLATLIWFAPMQWYETTPGVAMMGPFNLHFIRDAALTYLVSGAAMFWGTWKSDKTALVIGAAWPALHAVYHMCMWVMRGMPFDLVAAVNFSGIQLPAWIALLIIFKHKKLSK